MKEQAPIKNKTFRQELETENYYLVFDTETSIDASQTLKFGVYELHSDNELITRGIFYNASLLSGEEQVLLQVYAHEHDYCCIPRQTFISLLYRYGHNKSFNTLIIGHNLAFDLSRLMHEMQYAYKNFENGFSLKLCTCSWDRKNGKKRARGDSCRMHPSIHVKKIAPKLHLYEFADKKPRGNFLDTQTFARALLGPGSTSLASLGKILGIAEKKLEEDIQHGSLSAHYLDYAIRDVTATWQIFQALRAIYQKYNFSQKMQYIFSEASLGKALYKELHITPVMSRMQNIPQEYHGYAMTTYYGGRSEIHFRKEPVEVAYCDFKSEYPTVFSLLGLQELLLAESFEIQDITSETRFMLSNFSLEKLQRKQSWLDLRVLCKISGDNLMLPVRAQYNGVSNNIALCNVSIPDDKPVWYTLADVLASILLGGEIPHIEEAFELVPVGRIETHEHSLFDGLVKINPAFDDIFVTLINERTRIRHEMKSLAPDSPAYLQRERAQQALKLLANSTSYGINIELRTESTEEPILLYGNDGAMEAASNTCQIPGAYYCPLIGTHIPSGGRLLLAIAQRLGRDRGLNYAFCDTDSMAFVKPSDMPCSAFYDHVKSIREWFQPLNPYDQGELFELEKENSWQGEREALYCLAISAKRYVLYNKKSDGSFRIRKVSSHGLGAYSVSDAYKSYAPVSDVSLRELGLTSYQQWIYDIWYAAIVLAENGITRASPDLRALDTPVYHQVTLSTAHLYRMFAHIEGIKPFNFVTVFPGFSPSQKRKRMQEHPNQREQYMKVTSALYTPFTREIEKLSRFYVLQTNEQIHDIKPLTIGEALESYFLHPEWKSYNSIATGEMIMREVCITGYHPQGKESSYEVLELEDNDLPLGLAQEAIDLQYMTREKWERLKEQVRATGVNHIARELGVSNTALCRMLAKSVPPDQQTVQRLLKLLY